MEISWNWSSYYFVSLFFRLCNGYPINLQDSVADQHTQLLTGLVAVLLTICSLVFLAGCICCQRRNNFKEFRNSPQVATTASELDHGHVNPIANREFTIFTPLSPPHFNNNSFLASEQMIAKSLDDGFDVGSWFNETEKDFPRVKLKYIKELGRGWFGKVVEGATQDADNEGQSWNPVVVRILEATSNQREKIIFLQEAAMYRCGSHPNLLSLIGRCLDTVPFLLLQEYCSQGDLKGYLRSNKADPAKLLLTEYPLVWCCQLTSALKYLHDHNITHSDLASRNCQLTSNMTLKLGDYGLGVFKYPDDYYQDAIRVPVRWCSPESLICTQTTIQPKKASKESNVWSLGVTMWEICECGELPYANFNDDEVISQVLGPPNIRLDAPSFSAFYTEYIFSLMQKCWINAETRPTVTQIDSKLSDLLQFRRNTVTANTPVDTSLSTDDFDRRWESLKPNFDAISLEIIGTDAARIQKQLSPSLNNLHGSLDNLLGQQEPQVELLMDDDMEFQDHGFNESKLDFEDNTMKKHVSNVVFQRMSSGSETEDENWKTKVERGAYTEKVRLKSRSVADLMVLTHIDYSESETETPLPSLDYHRVNYKFGSEGNLLNIQDAFQEELKKFREERKDSILFVPDNLSQSSFSNVENLDSSAESKVNSSQLIKELNGTTEIKPPHQVFNVFNVTIDKFLPVSVNSKLKEIINFKEDFCEPQRKPSLEKDCNILGGNCTYESKICDNNLENISDISENMHDKRSNISLVQNEVTQSDQTENGEFHIKSNCETSDNTTQQECRNDLDNSQNINSGEIVNETLKEIKESEILTTDIPAQEREKLDTIKVALVNDGLKTFNECRKQLNYKDTLVEVCQIGTVVSEIADGTAILKEHGYDDVSEKNYLPDNIQLPKDKLDFADVHEFTSAMSKTVDGIESLDKYGHADICDKSKTPDNIEIYNTQLTKDESDLAETAFSETTNGTEISKRHGSSDTFEKLNIPCSIEILDEQLLKDKSNFEYVQEIVTVVPKNIVGTETSEDKSDEIITAASKNIETEASKGHGCTGACEKLNPPDVFNAQLPKYKNLDAYKHEIDVTLSTSNDGTKPSRNCDCSDISEKSDELTDNSEKFDRHLSKDKNDLTENFERFKEYVQANISAKLDKFPKLIDNELPKDNGDLADISQIVAVISESVDRVEVSKECGCADNAEKSNKSKDNFQKFEQLPKIKSDLTDVCQIGTVSETSNITAATKENGYSDISEKLDSSDNIEIFNMLLSKEDKEKIETLPKNIEKLNTPLPNNINTVLDYRNEDGNLKQVPKLSNMILNNIVFKNFMAKKVEMYPKEMQVKCNASFDTSMDQERTMPNPLTHSSVFTSTPFRKKEISLPSAENVYSSINIFSNPAENGEEDNANLNYSLETWDNFLKKTLDNQSELIGNLFDSFSSEPQSLLFIDKDGSNPASSCDSPKEDVSKTNFTFVLENGNEMAEQTFKLKDNSIKSEADKTFIKEKLLEQPTAKETIDSSWESGEGWFLHPQTPGEDLSGEMQIQTTSTDSYIGFGLDDEVMSAIRNELLSKLPHAQGAAPDRLIDDDELEPGETNEVFLKYNIYNTPLSPIPEESYVEELIGSDITRVVNENEDSDWSDHCETETLAKEMAHSTLGSPFKVAFHRHTLSQDSNCSNDTLFNLEELNGAITDLDAEDEVPSNGLTCKTGETQFVNGCNSKVSCTETNNNDDDKLSKTFIIEPEVKRSNQNEEMFSNTFITKPENIINAQVATHNDISSSDINKQFEKVINDFLLHEREHVFKSTERPNYAEFGKSRAVPLPSPEDNPWKQLPASLLNFDKVTLQSGSLLTLEPKNESNSENENLRDKSNTPYNEYVNIVNIENTKNSLEYDNSEKDNDHLDLFRKHDNEQTGDDNLFTALTDIRFNGPTDNQLMSTSFSESNNCDEQEWDSGSDSRSSSSGEFIWKEGEYEESLKALTAASHDVLENVKPMDGIAEDLSEESDISSSISEDAEIPEFVPSAWDKFAIPTKSALRSPEKKDEYKKNKGVWFKKEKYHCIYEYPKEPESPVLQSQDLWKPQTDIQSFTDWEFDGETYIPSLDDDNDIAPSYSRQPRNVPNTSSLYQLTSVPDFGPGNRDAAGSDDEFFISSSAQPFDSHSLSSQFFPGNTRWASTATATPDSGVEDVTPGNLTDKEYSRLIKSVPTLKQLASEAVNRKKLTRLKSREALGGLRHTRNKLKLDLPPSPSAFTSDKIFVLEPTLEPVMREKPTFTTFGKSRFLVQHVDTPPDESSSKNVSFEALPYKPFKRNECEIESYVNKILEKPIERRDIVSDENTDICKLKIEIVRGEASLLDSGDEDSGIESSTLERKSSTTQF